jgi:hypothetical protein
MRKLSFVRLIGLFLTLLIALSARADEFSPNRRPDADEMIQRLAPKAKPKTLSRAWPGPKGVQVEGEDPAPPDNPSLDLGSRFRVYTLCRHKLNFLNALALTLSRRERGL